MHNRVISSQDLHFNRMSQQSVIFQHYRQEQHVCSDSHQNLHVNSCWRKPLNHPLTMGLKKIDSTPKMLVSVFTSPPFFSFTTTKHLTQPLSVARSCVDPLTLQHADRQRSRLTSTLGYLFFLCFYYFFFIGVFLKRVWRIKSEKQILVRL